ncbi:glycosyltransferase family 4 protein [Streptomyces sp. TRM68367]|uniref:glycosyltransferase family 4 protein n=1 Tax=Streptomyces sp. TRM68367 TaxID=2758415 RepID=UPI00165AE304|nr:glycosyltransferase family 4 protein [Streptomyces sp. TRM68367]MBC9729263.1 glycosyltransferase family 4 protein [Streptomyces sp. TRM68367]
MRILAVLPTYGQVPPTGAVITTREYLRGLVKAGHTVQVVTTGRQSGRPRMEDGVQVWPLGNWRNAIHAGRPHLVITHHGDRRATLIVRHLWRVPHLLMVHGMSGNRDLGSPALAWFPSQACRDHYPQFAGPAIVLPPPIDPSRYGTTPGDMVTLNGATVAKGADVLAQVAARMPDTRFLVVKTVGRVPARMPRNVELIDRTDPRQVYARSRVLLMPSTVESYGRAGVEAMLSGIPVLASPLPGLREALGDAATYIPREDIDRWVEELRRLTDPGVYAEASAKAREHAAGLDCAGILREFEAACASLVRPGAVEPLAPAPAAAVGALHERSPDVVAWIHFGVPYRRAGSETMLHTMMRALRDAGLDVLVVCSAMPEAPPLWDVDGVPYAALDPGAAGAAIRAMRPRILLSHHDFAESSVALSKELRTKSVLVVHSDFDIAARPLALWPDLVVYNTEWVRRSLAPRYLEVEHIPHLVVHPPVIPEEHRAPTTGDRVTLVNLNRHKGVDTWRGAAANLRTLPFLGVTGGHGKQILRPVLRNMRIIPQTSDMRTDVWAHTRVLMMPSVYESYGMAAVEALASGIPVIAHPTPGLREALGDAGTFIDRADVRSWVEAIRELYPDGERRAAAVASSLSRSAFLTDQMSAETKQWVEAVQALLSRVVEASAA